jgi:hypothetical protein
MRDLTSLSRTVRVTVDLSPTDHRHLGWLADVVGSPSKAQVVREALHLFGMVATELAAGGEVRVTRRDGTESLLVPVGLLGSLVDRRKVAPTEVQEAPSDRSLSETEAAPRAWRPEQIPRSIWLGVGAGSFMELHRWSPK